MTRTVTAIWEPVTTSEAKEQIQGLEGISAFDNEIARLITVAREYAEKFTWSTIVESTIVEKFTAFDDKIILPGAPIISVTSVKYIDDAGIEQTVDSADYMLMNWHVPSYIAPAYGKSFPAPRGGSGDITVTYKAGYASAASVPAAIRQAILMMVRTWFDQREDVSNRTVNEMPMGSKYLLHHFRLNRF